LYDFSESGTGWYTLHPSNILYIVNEDGGVELVSYLSPPTAKIQIIDLSFTGSNPHLGAPERNVTAMTRYVGCSQYQTEEMSKAIERARILAVYSSNHIENSPRSWLVHQWFGRYDQARRERVRSTMKSIRQTNFTGYKVSYWY
jgi:hypothetical protein